MPSQQRDKNASSNSPTWFIYNILTHFFLSPCHTDAINLPDPVVVALIIQITWSIPPDTLAQKTLLMHCRDLPQLI